MIPEHTRVTFSGTLGAPASPVEQFAFGINFRPPTAAPGAARQAVANAAAVAYADNLMNHMGLAVVLREVKVAAIGPDGKYSDDPAIASVSIQGARNVGPQHAFQVALAISLNTATRGAKGRGRFYLPAPNYAVAPEDGLLSDADRDTMAAASLSFLGALQNIAGLGGAVVASTSGILSDVTSIRVGRALDTIRSRRTSIDEEYSGGGIRLLGANAN